jgi:dephospho-CoA kinase
VTAILVTGMSGTGKSSLLGELGRRGRAVVDLDDPGWTVEVPTDDGGGLEQLWDEARVEALLSAYDGRPLVVAGCAANQGRFYDRFAAVVLLTVPDDVLRARLATRDTNDFGKTPDELDRILRDLAEVEPLLRATATRELDATAPVGELADAVESLLAAPGR